MNNGLAEAFQAQPPAPCEDGCSNREKCAKELLACADFWRYTNFKRPIFKGDRIPSREIFDRVDKRETFCQEGDQLNLKDQDAILIEKLFEERQRLLNQGIKHPELMLKRIAEKFDLAANTLASRWLTWSNSR